ncbi:MAG: ribose 5-phosphate isomerase B [Firmicutes bacterium]|nr:ribose 5-phosphate isomerase B [Candidatus Colimorpha enterica]
MKIAIGCDHGAYILKDKVKAHLAEKGIEVIDCGTNGPESVHYPVYAKSVCKAVQAKEADLGILLCTTGIGMSMAANKFRGIRAALCSTEYQADMTRSHNDANVLVLGAGVTGEGLSLRIVDAFLSSSFLGGRHAVRVGMIEEIENEEYGNK